MNKKWDDPKIKYFPERVCEFNWSKKCYFQKENTPSECLRKDRAGMTQEFQCQYIAMKVDKEVGVNLTLKVNKNFIEMNQREAIINFAKGVVAVDILNKFSW